ncbi:IS5 family transposase [Methylomonas sp. MV1]|uniref:IS5 family transposase n=1 Tax=Methylomonas sp. MV1 TaxID=3073620 RepID=UPI0028A5537A|nr:IS5 family transposase [Methylomonas sp. MV1]MDT4330769.1 IS5 family transposase [Methylomonas sp. MV1]
MRYQEISDDFWELVAPLLERFKRRTPGGSKPVEFRTVLNGIFYLLKTGCQWAFLPSCYGSKSTVHEHFQRWASAGIFAEMFRLGAAQYEEFKGFKWAWQSMDGSLVQAPSRQSTNLSVEGIGRNPTDRGKSGSKIHLLVDQEGMPCGVALAGANVHDSRLVTATLEGHVSPAPKIKPEEKPHLCLDKAYDMKRVETEVRNHGYTPHIRRIGEEKQRGPQDIHPARRWVVERTFAWLKGFRAIRTRYTCRGTNYLALLHLACAIVLNRRIETA